PFQSPQVGIGSYIRVEETILSDGEQRKKNWNDPYTENVKAKKVTCKWQVDRPPLGQHNDVVWEIEGHGLHFMF
ncbi:unnamed protein product, partial [Ilex paraguariensis]